MTVNEVKEKTAPILRRYAVARAAVFGSVAVGKDTSKSDVDILVAIPRAYGLFEFIGMKNELEDALGKKVDLIEYGAIKKAIRENILKSQIPIL